MSQTTQRMPLAIAEQLAAKIVKSIECACDRVEVAGSIRRRAKLIGDVDLVAIAKPGPGDLFGQAGAETKLDHRLAELANARKLVPVAVGPRSKTYELGAWRGTKLNLYVVEPATWAVQMMIRTGPAEFSHRFVTHRRKRGLLADTMKIHEGLLYRIAERTERHAMRIKPTDPARYVSIYTPTEHDLFERAGVPWIEPAERQRFADWSMPIEALSTREDADG